jgi:hypothetical protein
MGACVTMTKSDVPPHVLLLGPALTAHGCSCGLCMPAGYCMGLAWCDRLLMHAMLRLSNCD